jgi:hypothetical protein
MLCTAAYCTGLTSVTCTVYAQALYLITYFTAVLMLSLHVTAGLNIASYVFTDSGPDCINGEVPQMQRVRSALDSVDTNFPKFYFSKQNMMMSEVGLTRQCPTHGGHTVEPMNMVFWNRYFNLVCNPTSSPPYDPSIPVCVDLGDYTNTNDRCYGSGPNGDWMDNIMQVCLMNFRDVTNGPGCNVRVSQARPHTRKRRACKLVPVAIVDGGMW